METCPHPRACLSPMLAAVSPYRGSSAFVFNQTMVLSPSETGILRCERESKVVAVILQVAWTWARLKYETRLRKVPKLRLYLGLVSNKMALELKISWIGDTRRQNKFHYSFLIPQEPQGWSCP